MYIPALIFPLWTCWHMSFPEKPKHAHCLLYIPPLTSTLSPSIIFTFSQLSAAHHFKKKPFIMLRVCMCVNCRYKAALAWAQMKTHSWQGIGEYRLLRCWQMFFYMAVRLLCVWRESDWAWSTPAKARLISTSNGIRNPYFWVKPDIRK